MLWVLPARAGWPSVARMPSTRSRSVGGQPMGEVLTLSCSSSDGWAVIVPFDGEYWRRMSFDPPCRLAPDPPLGIMA